MPSQTRPVAAPTQPTVFFTEGDTAPDMSTPLKDEETGEPIVLDPINDSVTVSIAWTAPHGSYYYSPRDRIVSEAPCVIDADQVANPGLVHWEPQVGDLTPPGQFWYNHEVTYANGRLQTVPSNTYQPMIIRSKVAGRAFQKPPISGN